MVTPIRRIPSSSFAAPHFPRRPPASDVATRVPEWLTADVRPGGHACRRTGAPPCSIATGGRPIGQRGRRRRGTFSDACLWRADRGSGRLSTGADDAHELRLDGVGHHVAPRAELVVERAAHLDHVADAERLGPPGDHRNAVRTVAQREGSVAGTLAGYVHARVLHRAEEQARLAGVPAWIL